MLRSLHVKNLALIDEAEVEFGEGLNILSGETGAGKSIIIGSINLALGGKVQKEMLRENADAALVELIFEVKEENIKAALAAIDVFPMEDGYAHHEQKDHRRTQCREDQRGDGSGVKGERGSGTAY